jgi:hypothetical protein
MISILSSEILVLQRPSEANMIKSITPSSLSPLDEVALGDA